MADEEKGGNPFNINTSTAGRFAAGGLLGGASLASILGLIKMITDMKRDKSRGEEEDTGLDRLVLTLPAKRAEAEERIDRAYVERFCSQIPRVGPDMEKSANWQTLVASLLAAGGGTVASYALVDKLFEIRRMKELEKQLASSQQEYLDKLDTASQEIKTAGILGDSDRTGDPSFNKLDYPIGLAVLATLLGAGGSAWLTKKFLDEYENEEDVSDPGFKPRKPIKVKRIVFRTASGDDEKEASSREIDPETFAAALGVYLDVCSGEAKMASDERVAEELQKVGMTAGDMYKAAANDEEFQKFMYILAANPDLRTQMKRMSMDTHPLLKYFKWAAGLPLISQITDRSLHDQLNRQYGPARELFPEAFRNGGIFIPPDLQDFGKKASVLDSLIGSMAAERALDGMSDAMKRKKQIPDEEAQDDDEELKSMVRELEIGAADPNAEEFVRGREKQIKEILTKLVRQGKI